MKSVVSKTLIAMALSRRALPHACLLARALAAAPAKKLLSLLEEEPLRAMPTCRAPKCFKTQAKKGKASRCMAPNPWIIFRKVVKQRGMSLPEVRASYDQWIARRLQLAQPYDRQAMNDALCGYAAMGDRQFAEAAAADHADLVESAAPPQLAVAHKGLVKLRKPKLTRYESQGIARMTAPLDNDDRALIRNALRGNNNVDLWEDGTRSGRVLTRRTFRQVGDGSWLRDEPVNCYGHLLNEQYGPHSHVFNSFFLAKLTEREGYHYDQVRRWTTRARLDIFALDKLIMFHNLSNAHWALAVVHVQARRIEYLDSFGSPGLHTMNAIYRYLKDEHRTKKGSPLTGVWTKYSYRDSGPNQMDGIHCAVFMLMSAHYILSDLPLTFGTPDMDRFREKLQLALIRREAI